MLSPWCDKDRSTKLFGENKVDDVFMKEENRRGKNFCSPSQLAFTCKWETRSFTLVRNCKSSFSKDIIFEFVEYDVDTKDDERLHLLRLLNL